MENTQWAEGDRFTLGKGKIVYTIVQFYQGGPEMGHILASYEYGVGVRSKTVAFADRARMQRVEA